MTFQEFENLLERWNQSQIVNEWKYEPINKNEDVKMENLDGMSRGELMLFYDKRRNSPGVEKTLANYALKKATAMMCREDGMIEQALRFEKECDDIYNRLPMNYRW